MHTATNTTRTVIVTRPQHQAHSWVTALHQKGIHVIHIPLLAISACSNTCETTQIHQTWQQLHQYNWVMFVSPNAVDYFFKFAPPQQKQNTPIWPQHTRAGSPGQGTTQTLIEHGVPPHLIDAPPQKHNQDSEHLWQNIQQRNWKSAHTLLVRGTSTARPPRNWLIEQLTNAGAQVDTLAVYHRQPVIPDQALQTWLQSAQARQACWLFSSAEALNYMGNYDWTQTTAIVTHSRIAKAARLAGFGQVICTSPDLHSLVETVESVA